MPRKYGDIAGDFGATHRVIRPDVRLLVYPLIKQFEQGPNGGYAAVAYRDVAGNYTIGWGHKCTVNDPLILETINAATAEGLLNIDLDKQSDYLEICLGPVAWASLNSYEKAALVDFVFNLGIGTFERSSLHHFVAENQLDKVPDEFGRWVYGGGQILAGLVKRREAEKELWLGQFQALGLS